MIAADNVLMTNILKDYTETMTTMHDEMLIGRPIVIKIWHLLKQYSVIISVRWIRRKSSCCKAELPRMGPKNLPLNILYLLNLKKATPQNNISHYLRVLLFSYY